MARRITDDKKVGVEFGKFRRNIMGTLSFEFKLPNMRKMQDFIVYPATSGDTSIMIQSDTRIGRIDMSNGAGIMSQSHPNGAYGVHLQFDKLVPFFLTDDQLSALKEQLAKTAGSSVGSSVVKSDNSGADKFAKGGSTEEIKTLWRIKDGDAEMVKKGTSQSINRFFNSERKKHLRGEKSILDGGAGLESWYEDTTKEEVLRHHRGHRSTDQEYAKGGKLTPTYIPNENIESIKTRFGQTFRGKDVLDGAYVKGEVKTPKVSRYMFEEEEYEYADGGTMGSDALEAEIKTWIFRASGNIEDALRFVQYNSQVTSPFRLVYSAVSKGFIEPYQINADLLTSAIETSDDIDDTYADSGEGFGSSDMNAYIGHMISGAGITRKPKMAQGGEADSYKFFDVYDKKTDKTLKIKAESLADAKIYAEESIDFNEYKDGEKINLFDWFWNYDYRHYLRDASPKQRNIVKQKFIEKGLELDGSSPKHAYIIVSTINPSELTSFKKVGSDGIKFADGGTMGSSTYALEGFLNEVPDQIYLVTIIVTDWNNDGSEHIFWGLEVRTQSGDYVRYIQNAYDFLNFRSTLDSKDIKVMRDYNQEADRTKTNEIIDGLVMTEIPPIYTSYSNVQHYGGAEEGGWYYHTREAIEEVTEAQYLEIESERLDSYGEGISASEGFIFGEDEKLGREYYS